MTKTFAILLLAAAALAAQANTTTQTAATKTTKKTTAAAKTAPKAASSPKPMTIPAGATANADGTFAYTDKDGKKWTYANTPFGVMRAVPSSADTAAPVNTAQVKVTQTGDKVRFETATPFGPMVKEKNKADLTDEERALVNAQTAKQD